jgi:tartrate dehydratase alpha subunit/fumarate hydratase class I-like protein
LLIAARTNTLIIHYPREFKELPHDRHPPGRFHRQRCRRVAVHQLLPPGGLHSSLAKAYEREESPPAKDAIAQILINSRMCAEGHRPICQDTGIVNAFLKVGMDVRFEPAPGEERKDVQQMVDEGVRRAYLDPDNKLRASILADPAGKRTNTKDNTPAW